MLTAYLWFIDVGEAVDQALAELHTWRPLLAAPAVAVATVDETRSDAVRTASGRLAVWPCSSPLTCPDVRPDASADARPDGSGHGSGGGS